MAFHIPAVETFDSNGNKSAKEWNRWLQRFENYIEAVDIQDDTRKRKMLLHFVGPQTFEEFSAMPNTGTDYKSAKDTLTKHFCPKVVIDYEISKFRELYQREDESIDSFHIRLREQGNRCDFADTNKEIKSQIILKTKDSALRQKGLKGNLKTLDEALNCARANELSLFQNLEIEKTLKPNKMVNAVVQRPEPSRRPSSCFNCGGAFPHRDGRQSCPAYHQNCKTCKKRGHFESCCQSTRKTVQRRQDPGKRRIPRTRVVNAVVPELDSENSDVEEEYAWNISHLGNKGIPKFKVDIGKINLIFTADTAATCNIVDEHTFEKSLKNVVQIMPSKDNINPYGSDGLKPIGKFKATVVCNDVECTDTFYVLPGNSGCLLGIKTCKMLNLIKIAKHAINQVSNNVTKKDPSTPTPVNSNSTNPMLNFSKPDDNKEKGPIANKWIKENPSLFSGVGKFKDFKVELHIDEAVPPVAQRHRRIPFHNRKKLEAELDRLEELDIIERVEGPTPWVSQIVVAPKPRNPDEIRLCVDMRKANTAIRREHHPSPTIDDIQSKLNGWKVFSKLDLRSGYHQLELDDQSRYITTFSTHVGLRRYKRLNFGINSASEVFQNVIGHTIDGIGDSKGGAMNISDDIIIGGVDQDSHDKALECVFERLLNKGLTLNLPKCEFNKDKIEFYGMVFSANGMEPSPSRLEALLSMKIPESVADIRSLLGMTNYSARFIPNYSTITEPLRSLTKHSTKFKWGTEQQQAFDSLINHLSKCPVVSYFDTSKPTEVIVDASPVGLGAILAQYDEEGIGTIVAYASRSLSNVERRYAQIEREALAAVWACERFHIYVHGSKFTIVTDHKPLLSMYGNPNTKLPMRIERWSLRLLPYEFNLRYRQGKFNPSDYLSRHPQPLDKPVSREEHIAEEYINFIASSAVPKALTERQILNETLADPTLRAVSDLIISGKWYLTKNSSSFHLSDHSTLIQFSKVKHELSLTQEGLVLRNTRIVIPLSLQKQSIQLAHEGHQGLVKTKSLLREKVWFPGIDQLTKELIDRCTACTANFDPKRREPLKMTELPRSPWSQLSTDFFGPLPSGHYLLALRCDRTRYPEVEIITSLSANTVIPVYDKIFAARGIPDILKSDNGTPFQSREFAQFSEYLGFKHQKVTPYWPEANGGAENFMKTLGKLCKSAQLEGRPWKQELYKFLRNYRATPHCSTGIAPATALNGYHLKTKLPEFRAVEAPGKIDDKDRSSKAQMKAYAEKRRNIKLPDIQVNDKVLMKNVTKSGKLVSKFQKDPFRVIEKKGSMIIAKRGEEVKARNSSHFRRITTDLDPLKVKQNPSFDSDDDEAPQPIPENDQQPRGNVQVPCVATRDNRPRRDCKPPGYLKDYVVNSGKH